MIRQCAGLPSYLVLNYARSVERRLGVTPPEEQRYFIWDLLCQNHPILAILPSLTPSLSQLRDTGTHFHPHTPCPFYNNIL